MQTGPGCGSKASHFFCAIKSPLTGGISVGLAAAEMKAALSTRVLSWKTGN